MDLDPSDGLAVFTAATTAGNVTLKLEIKNGSMAGKGPTRTIEVVAPSGVYLIKQPGTVTAHLHGYFSVGFIGWAYLLPRDASFDNLTVSEGEDPPSVDGYFLPDSGEKHTVGSWSGVGPGNIISGSKMELPDFIGILRKRTPYSPGNFKWQIPWRVGTKNGVYIKQFASVLQHFYSLDSSGDAHVKKGAGPFTARLNDPTAEVTPKN